MFKLKAKKALSIFIYVAITVFIAAPAIAANISSDEQARIDQRLKEIEGNEILELQWEIDQYVFISNTEDIANAGFTITHTAPKEDYVEIGILPFNEDNADFLCEIFSEDKIKVVEGVQAVLLKDKDIKIQINNKLVQTDVAPFIEEGRTLIPLHGVMEELGAFVTWEEESQAVGVYTDSISIELLIGLDVAKVAKNTNEITVKDTLSLDAPARIVQDRTFIPIRFVAEALGFDVDWIEETKTVTINGTLPDQYKDGKRIDIIGNITGIKSNTILVEGVFARGTQYDKAHVSFDEDTLIVSGNTKENFNASDFEKGMRVEVVFDGAVKESYPVQARAKEITVYENSFDENNGPSLEEMGLAIPVEKVKEMTLYTLMQEKIKTFTQDETNEIITSLNTSPTFTGAYIMMLAGNSITITMENDDIIQLTSFGSKDHVVLSGRIDGETISGCIISPKVGTILLSNTGLQQGLLLPSLL
jgi:hypothetical protein